MRRLLLVDPDEMSRRAIATRLRDDGHEVLEADEEHAVTLFREGVNAVFVWNARDAGRAAALLRELHGDEAPHPDGRPPVLFLAPSPQDSELALDAGDRPRLVGQSAAMADLRATLRRLACRPRTHVLVGGEPGTGKLTLARVLHHETHQPAPFVHVIPERLPALLDSGLAEFGERGGTLYVSSLPDVPHAEQRRLVAALTAAEAPGRRPLRFIGGVTLSSSQGSLLRIMRERVHPELASRLPVLLDLLPLRKRKVDIPELVTHFLSRGARGSHSPEPGVTAAALDKLSAHDWPANLHELANVLEQAALSAGAVIDLADLPICAPGERRPRGVDYQLPSDGIDFSEFERAVLAQALELSGGNQTRAASLLGLTRDQMRYRMGKFGISR